MAAKKKATPSSAAGRRAWRLLRLAVLWMRKGGAFKRGIIVELRLLPGYLKGLRPGGRHSAAADEQHRYWEREFSIQETPIIQFKMPSARFLRFPCIAATAAADDDGEDFFVAAAGRDRRSASRYLTYDSEESSGDDAPELKGIDEKAEQFIEKFYEQIKMQQEASWLQHNEILLRGVN